MKKLALAALFVVLTAAVSLASPTLLTVQFLSPGSNTYNGLYTYPYNGTLNGKPTTFMCITDHFEITAGETWQAVRMPDTPGWMNAEKWLYREAQEGTAFSIPAINAAAWWIYDNTFGLPTLTLTPDAQLERDDALLEENVDQPGFMILQPVIWNSPLGEPQYFVAPTPEPSTLLLIGSGLIGVCLRARRVLG